MVDFNSEITVSTPSADIVKILILQRRSDVFDAYESLQKDDNSGINTNSLAIVKARLYTLFLELQPMLRRKKSSIEYNQLLKDVKDESKIEEVIFTLNDFIDTMKITRIDNRKEYDSTRAEAHNKVMGF